MATKKKATVKQGIILRKSSKGISVHIHASNGNKLAVMSGYNNRANALKGLTALTEALYGAYGSVPWGMNGSVFQVTDLTKPAKKK